MSGTLSPITSKPRDAVTSGARHRRNELPCGTNLYTLEQALAILADPMRDMRYLETGLGPAIQDHLNHIRLGRTKPVTIDAKERILARLAISCPTVGIRELEYEHLERYLLTVPEKSWRIHRSHINTFLKWAILFDRRSVKNPVELLPRLRPNPSRVLHTFDDLERSLIVDAARYMDDPARDRVRALLMLTAGIRKGEARGLRHGDVDPNRREVTVLGKNDKERTVPIEDDQFWLAWGVALLTPLPRLGRLPGADDYVWFPMRVAGEYRGRARQVTRAYPDRPMLSRGFHEWWERLLSHSGVDYRKPHMTRHTYATDALDASDGDIYGVKELLGHENIATTQLYLHSSRKRKNAVAAALARVRTDNSDRKDSDNP